MKALVVFASMYGNTRRIAEGLSERTDVTVAEVGDRTAGSSVDVDLLVVGGPTHAFGLSRPGTRRDAAGQGTGADTGIREWLARIPPAPPGVTAVAFDTRLHKPVWLVGSAACATAKRLRRQGYRVDAMRSFSVADRAGALLAGEVGRARWWGADLGRVAALSRS